VAAVSSKIRIGVVGLGAVAQSVHLPLIQRRWDLFDLVAIADLSPTLLGSVGDQFGVGTEHRHGSLTAMLDAEKLDGVVILTSGSHGAPALEAMERGVAVFCEKPLAFSLAEVDALAAAEERAGRPLLLLAYMKEYDPAVQALRAMLPAAEDIRYVDVEVLHPSSAAQLAFANLQPPARDFDQTVLAGLIARDAAAIDAAIGADTPAALRSLYTDVIAGSLIHDISLLRSLLGSIVTIDTAAQWSAGADAGSLEFGGTIGAASIDTAARVHLTWNYLPDYPAYRETVRIHHTTGSLELEFTVPYLLNAPTEFRAVASSDGAEVRSSFRSVTEAFETELARFHAMAIDGIEPLSGIRHGREDLVTAQRMAAALAGTMDVVLGGEAGQL
jgi:predicted dehydrogenase